MGAAIDVQGASDGILHQLLTDTAIVGLVSWVSLVVTALGFAITIAQIFKVKSTAEAARIAAIRATREVHNREHGAKLNEALSHMRLAIAHIQTNTGAAGAYIDTVCNTLVDAHYVSGGDPNYEMLTHILRLREDFRYISGLGAATATAARLRRIGDNLDEAVRVSESLAARLRYNNEQAVGLAQ